ncbi:18537_t:CDS:2 [Gigaspora margarita]|uniref:18537_t:CDS:1 n=1 Tax=Gigaspora margarita TaxID=4874 RepID=A0ABN7UJA8_GIGMA|nr:18537_t:CDS:2 [Gigaspora margarita]
MGVLATYLHRSSSFSYAIIRHFANAVSVLNVCTWTSHSVGLTVPLKRTL